MLSCARELTRPRREASIIRARASASWCRARPASAGVCGHPRATKRAA